MILQILAEATFVLREQSVVIRRLRLVKETQTALEFQRSDGSPVLFGYVDAELHDGTAISWLVDVTWTESSWTIECELTKSAGGEQRSLQKMPTITAQALNDLREKLLGALDALLALRPDPLGAG